MPIKKPFLIYGETPMVTDNALEDIQVQEEKMIEVWKDIEGYEGRYQISNLGRLKSFLQERQSGKIKTGNETKKGYLAVLLYADDGTSKWYPVHRLVATAFIENPDELPQVNHKDENKKNNRADNLEWCTNNYNVNYGTRNIRTSLANMCCETTSRKVYAVDPNGKVTYYDSIGEAERQTGNSHSNIVRALKGRRKSCGNMQWFYC